MAGAGGWQLKKTELGRIYENLDLDRLKQWSLEGRVDEIDEVLRPGDEDWLPAARIKELEAYFRPSAHGTESVGGGGRASGLAATFSFGSGGAAGSRRASEDDDIGVDLTPMIDVTFLLLIFFVVTAQFSHRGIQVNRPETETGVNIVKDQVTVQVDRDGRIFFEGKEVTLPMLERNLERRLATSDRKSVVVDADKDARHGIVTQVIDKCKQAGAEKIRFPTTVKSGE